MACPKIEQVRFQQMSEILTEQYIEEDRHKWDIRHKRVKSTVW